MAHLGPGAVCPLLVVAWQKAAVRLAGVPMAHLGPDAVTALRWAELLPGFPCSLLPPRRYVLAGLSGDGAP